MCSTENLDLSIDDKLEETDKMLKTLSSQITPKVDISDIKSVLCGIIEIQQQLEEIKPHCLTGEQQARHKSMALLTMVCLSSYMKLISGKLKNVETALNTALVKHI